ncbi:unnamed protein product [Boreogadus saida]
MSARQDATGIVRGETQNQGPRSGSQVDLTRESQNPEPRTKGPDLTRESQNPEPRAQERVSGGPHQRVPEPRTKGPGAGLRWTSPESPRTQNQGPRSGSRTQNQGPRSGSSML